MPARLPLPRVALVAARGGGGACGWVPAAACRGCATRAARATLFDGTGGGLTGAAAAAVPSRLKSCAADCCALVTGSAELVTWQLHQL